MEIEKHRIRVTGTEAQIDEVRGDLEAAGIAIERDDRSGYRTATTIIEQIVAGLIVQGAAVTINAVLQKWRARGGERDVGKPANEPANGPEDQHAAGD